MRAAKDGKALSCLIRAARSIRDLILARTRVNNIERTQEKIDNNNSIAPGYIQRRNFSRFKERICRPYYKGGRINIPVLQKQIEASIKDNSLKLADLNSIQSPNPKFFNEKIDEANTAFHAYTRFDHAFGQGKTFIKTSVPF